MLRKIYNYVSTAIIIILILVIILISKSNSKKNDDYSNWINQEENYITVTAKIGNVYKNVRNDAVVGLNSSKFKSYTISNSKIRDDLHSGSIIQSGEYLDQDLSFKIDYLGKIESIKSVGNNSNIIVSDYRNLSSTVKIEEKYARYIEIGDTVNVAIDEISLEGKITNHSYNIVDGYFLVDIEYESSSVIYPGSKVEVDVLIDSYDDWINFLLSFLQIDNLINMNVRDLSGGEKQRVSICRALSLKPRLILADEPTGNLDPANKNNIVDIFKKINKLGITILVVTHDNAFDCASNRHFKINGGSVHEEN